jgi:predicted metal-binding membrane protein
MTTVAPNIVRGSRRGTATAIVFGCLAVGAWMSSVGALRGVGMADRFSVGSIGFFVALWVVMMAAMMFPSVWPAVAMFGLIGRRRSAGRVRPLGGSAMFVLGYLGSWAAFGVVAYGLLAVARVAGLGGLSDIELSRFLVAPVALAAVLYQATPLKRACLRHCRGPFSFFLEHWRDGPRGALRMGGRHGGYCVGCCWMLMLVLLAVGAMNITWMSVASVAIAVEKLTPAAWARLARGALTAGLAVIAVLALVKPSWLPGLGGMDGSSGM